MSSNDRQLLLGCRMAIPVGEWVDFSVLFSVSVKVLPVTPLVSGVFVHRACCAYFLRIERVVEMRGFLWWTQENHQLSLQWRRKSCNANGVLVDP